MSELIFHDEQTAELRLPLSTGAEGPALPTEGTEAGLGKRTLLFLARPVMSQVKNPIKEQDLLHVRKETVTPEEETAVNRICSGAINRIFQGFLLYTPALISDARGYNVFANPDSKQAWIESGLAIAGIIRASSAARVFTTHASGASDVLKRRNLGNSLISPRLYEARKARRVAEAQETA